MITWKCSPGIFISNRRRGKDNETVEILGEGVCERQSVAGRER
jgi:hypothetical protein